jgi:hypothetical protein
VKNIVIFANKWKELDENERKRIIYLKIIKLSMYYSMEFMLEESILSQYGIQDRSIALNVPMSQTV